jgi:hypothetical protein
MSLLSWENQHISMCRRVETMSTCLLLLLLLLVGVSVGLRRGDLIATSIRYQYPNTSVSEWLNVNTGDSPRLGVRGRTYLHLRNVTVGLFDVVKVQFQITEPHRRHFTTPWLLLSGELKSVKDAELTFVHTDVGHLVRVDLEPLEYTYLDGRDTNATKDSSVWFVRHVWERHTAVDREWAFSLLLGVTFFVGLLSTLWVFVTVFRDFDLTTFAAPVPVQSQAPPAGLTMTTADTAADRKAD